MSQEIEIEIKNMVTKDEFEKLCTVFSITSFTEQVNHYFETEDFAIKNNGAALRIRYKNNTWTLTLKQPAEIGLLETHQQLSKEAACKMIETGKPVEGQIATILEGFGISTAIKYFGSLTTKRAEIEYEGGLLVFDHSFYFHEDDYELEYEVDEESKKEAFLQLLSAHNIPIRPAQNKVQRFFLAKQHS